LKSIHPEDEISLLSTNHIIETPKTIRPTTAGEMMNTCTRTIYRLIRDGSLPATKGHGGFQLSPQSVQDFVERQIEHYRAEELGY
jgi:excisionase family DNA binding protein